MSLYNRFPVGPLLPTQGLLESMFDEVFRPNASPEARTWMPHLDAVEHEDAYLVHVELPGIDPADVTLTYADDQLTIAGSKTQVETKEGETLRRVERRYGSFERKLGFPKTVSVDGITAAAAHGVLTIRLPKAAEAQPRRIEVKAGDATSVTVEHKPLETEARD